MDEKEKNSKSSERSQDFSSDSEQNKKNERSSTVFAWWYSLVERVFCRESSSCSDFVTITLGVLSLLLIFSVLLFSAMMAIKGVQSYDFF